MGTDTKIQWCDHTMNFWIGCTKVSEACKHCYAEVETYPRVQRAAGRELWGVDGDRHVTSKGNWCHPEHWNRDARHLGKRKRVFVNSMSDFFEARTDLEAPRRRAWDVIARCPYLDWLLLTKRPENIPEMLPRYAAFDGRPQPCVWSHVALGTTVETQARAHERLDELVRHRDDARMLFVSVEPQLEEVDLRPWLHRLDWVIVGGESGAHARDFRLAWARSLRVQCREYNVPFFMKQAGARAIFPGGGLLQLRNKKGGDLAELPPDLQVREQPRWREEGGGQ